MVICQLSPTAGVPGTCCEVSNAQPAHSDDVTRGSFAVRKSNPFTPSVSPSDHRPTLTFNSNTPFRWPPVLDEWLWTFAKASSVTMAAVVAAASNRPRSSCARAFPTSDAFFTSSATPAWLIAASNAAIARLSACSLVSGGPHTVSAPSCLLNGTPLQ